MTNFSGKNRPYHGPISNPGTLLANLPGILGFYPHDSVILAGFHDGEVGNIHTLGPVLRLNIDDLRFLGDACEALARTGVAFCFAFVIGDEEANRDAGVFDLLLAAASCGEVPILGAWHAPEIATGSPYALIFAEDGGPDPHSEWMSGSIPLVADSITMRGLVGAGELPDVDREEAMAFFRHAEVLGDPGDIVERAQAMESALLYDPHGLRAALEELRRVVHSLSDDQGDEARDRAAEALAPWLARTWLRDCVISVLFELKHEARVALVGVSQRNSGEVRANALAIYAALVLGEPASFRAPIALAIAQEECPGHRLSQLLLQGYQQGIGVGVVETMKRGSLATLESAGVLGEGDLAA